MIDGYSLGLWFARRLAVYLTAAFLMGGLCVLGAFLLSRISG
jgi:hypothetical protein